MNRPATKDRSQITQKISQTSTPQVSFSLNWEPREVLSMGGRRDRRVLRGGGRSREVERREERRGEEKGRRRGEQEQSKDPGMPRPQL